MSLLYLLLYHHSLLILAATKRKKIELIVKPNYQATIIRISLGVVLILFGVETATETDFNALQSLSVRSLLNLDIWVYQIIHNFELAKTIISSFFIGIGTLLFLGITTRSIGTFLAIIFTLGIASEPQLLTNPEIILFNKSLNFTFIGAAIGLIFNDSGALNIKSFFITTKVEQIDENEIKKHNISRLITKKGLSITLILITLSVFFWKSPNNIIWSHHAKNFFEHFSYFSLPVMASIIGSAGLLLLFGIGNTIAAATIGVLFIIITAINGLPAYTFLIIIGSAFSLIAGEEFQRIAPQAAPAKGKKKFDKKKKNR